MPYKTLGKFPGGQAKSTDFGFYDMRGGLNVKAAPQLVGDEDLTLAEDGYLRAEGGFQSRNGMSTFGTAINAQPLILARFYQEVLQGNVLSNPVLMVLGQTVGALYEIPSTGAVTPIGSIGGATAKPMTWVRIQDPNDPHFPGGLTDCMVICTGSGGPYIFDGTNLYAPAGWSAAVGARWCAAVNGILWFGGIPAFPNQVFGTGDGILQSMETLPAIRNFVLSAPVTGLCAQGSGATAALVIGRNTGLSVLYGTGPTNFFLQDVPFPDGVVAGRTMVSAYGNVYFLGHMAYYVFDGQSVPQPISDKVEPWILNDPLTPGFPMNGDWSKSWACVYNNRIHLGYISAGSYVILCYDLVVNGWTVLTPNPGLASMILLDAPGDPNPYQALVGDAVAGQAWNWDVLGSPGGFAAAAMDGPNPVLAIVQSKYFKLGEPGTNKRLQRFYPEFLVAGQFVASITLRTNYGATTLNSLAVNPGTAVGTGVWDLSMWDDALWAGVTGTVSFLAPDSRLDYPGTQADAFAFGVQMNQALAPWIWVGGTGVFTQGGRT